MTPLQRDPKQFEKLLGKGESLKEAVKEVFFFGNFHGTHEEHQGHFETNFQDFLRHP